VNRAPRRNNCVTGHAYRCPGCSGELSVNSIGGERKYDCLTCGGCVIMVAALRHLAPAVAVQLWTEDQTDGAPAAGVHCPFCGNEMQPRALPAGTGAVCRPCEAVWLDHGAVEAVKIQVPVQEGPSLSSVAMRCPECGAPVANAWEQACRYCGCALHLETTTPGA